MQHLIKLLTPSAPQAALKAVDENTMFKTTTNLHQVHVVVYCPFPVRLKRGLVKLEKWEHYRLTTCSNFFLLIVQLVLLLIPIIPHLFIFFQKYQQLLKAYYIYSFTLWIFITILTVSLSMYSNIYIFSLYPIRLKDIWFILSDVFTIVGLFGKYFFFHFNF